MAECWAKDQLVWSLDQLVWAVEPRGGVGHREEDWFSRGLRLLSRITLRFTRGFWHREFRRILVCWLNTINKSRYWSAGTVQARHSKLYTVTEVKLSYIMDDLKMTALYRPLLSCHTVRYTQVKSSQVYCVDMLGFSETAQQLVFRYYTRSKTGRRQSVELVFTKFLSFKWGVFVLL